MKRFARAFLLLALVSAIVFPIPMGIKIGLHRPYHDIADQDMVLLTQALLVNEGQPNNYHEHPGSLTIRAAAGWLRLTRALGARNIVGISEVSRDHLADQLQALAVVGRTFAIANMMLLLCVFAFLLRLLTSDLLLVAAGTWLLAASQGVFLEIVTVRTEPISLTMTLAALAAMIVAVRRAPRTAVVASAAAGVFVYIAMVNKVQAGITLAAFPALFVVFAEPPLPAWTEPSRDRFARGAAIVLAVVALVASWFGFFQTALAVIAEGLSSYHWALLAGSIASAVAMNRLKGRSWRELASLALGFVSGFCIGYLINAPEFNGKDHHSAIFFIEHLRGYCTSDCHGVALGDIPSVMGKVFTVTLSSKLSWTWGLLQYPFFLIYWVALAGGIASLARRRWARAARVFALLGLALFVENVFRLRYVDTKSLSYVCYYYGMVEPFVVLAAILGFAGEGSFRWQTASRAFIATTTIAVAAMSAEVNMIRYHANAFNGLGMQQGTTNFCMYIPHTKRVSDLAHEVGICP
jgi:hypothetical protein